MKVGLILTGAHFSSTWLLNWTKTIGEFVGKSQYEVYMFTTQRLEVSPEMKEFVSQVDTALILDSSVLPNYECLSLLAESDADGIVCSVAAKSQQHIQASKGGEPISRDVLQFWVKENPTECMFKVDAGHFACTSVSPSVLQGLPDGATYRDIMEGADNTVYIHTKAHSVVELVAHI